MEKLMTDTYLRQIFTRLAKHARDHSDDPSTQNAAAWGHNGTPVIEANRVVFELTPADREKLNTDRDWKLAVMEHAERRCTYHAVKYAANARYIPEVMYALWAACPDCARAIVQAGIKTVHSLAMPTPPRWRELVELGDEVLTRGGVKHVRHPLPEPKLGVTIRFDREELLL